MSLCCTFFTLWLCPLTVRQKSIRVTGKETTFDLEAIVNDKDFFDITFLCRGKVSVPGHAVILLARSPGMAEKVKKGKPIEVDCFYEHFRAVRQYLYVGDCRFEEIDEMAMLSVIQAARTLELAAFIPYALHALKSKLTLDNCFQVLKTCHELGDEPTLDVCISFCVAAHQNFVAHPNFASGVLPPQVITKEVIAATQPVQPMPKLPDLVPVRQFYEGVYTAMQGPNVMLVCDSGRELPCHKIFLATQSVALAAEMASAKKSVDLPFNDEVVKAALKNFYYGFSGFESGLLPKLLEFAFEYDVDRLVTTVMNQLMTSVDKDNVFAVLRLSYSKRIASHEQAKDLARDLQEICYDYVTSHLRQVDLYALKGNKLTGS